MTTQTISRTSYPRISDKPLTEFEIEEPFVSTAVSVTSLALLVITAPAAMPVLSIGLGGLTLLPVMRHGFQIYTGWIPECARMMKGEVIRYAIKRPNVMKGLLGWQGNCLHSSHFDQKMAEALVQMCKKNKWDSAVHFDCGGKGEYIEKLKQNEIDADGFDFSASSVRLNPTLQLTDLNASSSLKQYDLVFSFEVMSKTLPGEEAIFAQKLISAAKQGGVIVVSCALPDQSGPNSNPLSLQMVSDIFYQNGCTLDPSLSCKLRRVASPIHPWLRKNTLAFIRN